MGQMIVDRVVQMLRDGGIRTEAAFPESKLVRIEEPVAAVSLQNAEPKKYTAEVLVEILAPQEIGGYLCQKKALEACAILETGGGVCQQGKCQFLRNGNLFRVPIYVTFRFAARAGNVESLPKPSIVAGGMSLGYVTAFSSIQKGDGGETEAPWEVTVEEFFPWGVWNTMEPEEPFALELQYQGNVERYKNCKWIQHQRIKEELGIRQIRKAKATGRVLTSL